MKEIIVRPDYHATPSVSNITIERSIPCPNKSDRGLSYLWIGSNDICIATIEKRTELKKLQKLIESILDEDTK